MMIYTDEEIKQKIMQMVHDKENEIVEFKEAKTNFSFKDIGKYFSAISNEANLRGAHEGWLVFGVTDKGNLIGTEFRKQGKLQSLKREIADQTNERLTFLEIYTVNIEHKRIVAFQIPPAMRGIPTTWQGAAYARDGDSIAPLPMHKMDLIRNQIGMDWSKEIIEEATISDLDEEALEMAQELFTKGQRGLKGRQDVLTNLSLAEMLNKVGMTIKGKLLERHYCS